MCIQLTVNLTYFANRSTCLSHLFQKQYTHLTFLVSLRAIYLLPRRFVQYVHVYRGLKLTLLIAKALQNPYNSTYVAPDLCFPGVSPAYFKSWAHSYSPLFHSQRWPSCVYPAHCSFFLSLRMFWNGGTQNFSFRYRNRTQFIRTLDCFSGNKVVLGMTFLSDTCIHWCCLGRAYLFP